MNALWIFFIIVLFCIYVLIGLHLTSKCKSFIESILTWIVYTIMCSTFTNVFLLAYFWGVVHKKKGPTGLRGPIGEKGAIGLKGKCELDLVEAYLIKELMQQIDDLYFAKTNQHLINTDNYTTPCAYLNNKIAVMAGSRQYKTIYKNLYISYNPKLYDTDEFNTETQQTDTKPIASIIFYLKNIWKDWFNLIYNSSGSGSWFTDKYADEDYAWSGSDPFLEIRKYDVYYWGLTRNFRPLKAEICRTTDFKKQNSKFPIINQVLEPRLKVIQTNDYYSLRKEGTEQSFDGIFLGLSKPSSGPVAGIWSPNKVTVNADTFYPVGDILTKDLKQTKKNDTIVGDIKYKADGENGPDMKTILVSGDVVDPIGYTVLDSTAVDKESDENIDLSVLECPRGYKGLGTVAKSAKHDYNNFKCIPEDCVEEVVSLTPSKKIWHKEDPWYNHNIFQSNYGWNYDYVYYVNVLEDQNIEALPGNSYNFFSIFEKKKPFYKIKDSCLTPPPDAKKAAMKTVESKYNDLGIGWHGHPYKLDPKYSIFSFLGLAPEGMIVHSGTGRRYYAIHYGGEESSIYIVLMNDDTGKYTKAFRSNSDEKKTTIEMKKISKKDTRQQWRFILEPNDKKHFKLLNIYNNRNLNIDLHPTLGNAVYSTIENGDSDNYLFSFIPAFGTHLNNLEN